MDPYLDFLTGVVAFVLVAGTGMSVYWLWLRERRRRLTGTDEMVEALREEHAQYQAEVGARLAELEERVDFAERRLAQERQASRPPQLPPGPAPE
jgi:hypothetical protein